MHSKELIVPAIKAGSLHSVRILGLHPPEDVDSEGDILLP